MFSRRILMSSGIPSWLFPWRRDGAPDQSATLTKQIERQFMYRGAPLLEVRTITLEQEKTSAVAEIVARPLYQDDSRLKYKTWAQLFAEQVFEDTAKVLWILWTQTPTLEQISLRVYSRPLSDLHTTDNLILRVRAAGAHLKTTVQQWKKHAPLALLHKCETVYEFDPRSGLRPLQEDGSQAKD